MTSLFDAHAHLAMCENSGLLERAKKAHVTRIMNIAVDKDSLDKGKALQKESADIKILLAAATTPHDLTSAEDPFFSEVRKAAKEKVLSAIGETGLEYFHSPQTKIWQQEVFLRYATLAYDENLPLIVHCRDAFPQVLALLTGFPPDLRGMVHCFTGSYDHAVSFLKRGWYLSFSGIITYPKSTELHEVVKKVPSDKILVETDSPYLAPQNMRGKKNEPSFLPEIVATIASLKGLAFEEVAKKTFDNATTLFNV